MKILYIVTIILMHSFSGFSQKPPDLTVHFTAYFNPRFDRGREDIAYTAKLVITDHMSRFYMIPDDAYQRADENDLRFIPDTSMQIFTDTNEKSLYSLEYSLNGKSFYVSDSLYPMKWELQDDSLMVGDILCKKAECDFRGRHYTAWFTEDFPVPFGPWKMGGLPGLILDLEDKEKNLVIKMQSIIYDKEEIQIPLNIKYTYREYVDVTRKFIENLRAGGRAASSGSCLTCQNHSTYELATWEKMYW